MNLDDVGHFHELDTQDMLSEINGLPDQLQAAWELGATLPLPRMEPIHLVVVAGMGGSAIGADLLAAYAAPVLKTPLIVWRNYDLPAYAAGPETLVIALSHSGDTEETISAFESGYQLGARVLALTTGGQLAQKAVDYGVPLWRFAHVGQPRAAVGYSFGLLLAVLHRLGIVPDPSVELTDAVLEMRTQQASFLAETPVVQNLAKQMAGRLRERWPTVLGAGLLAPVARRWRTQISEIAKAVGQYEELPEADHNMLAGTQYPEALIRKSIMVFLRASSEHPRHALRTDLTREILQVQGFDTDVIESQGNTRLAQQWTCLHFGDYAAFYLAMAYGVDPTPVHSIEAFKVRMKAVL